MIERYIRCHNPHTLHARAKRNELRLQVQRAAKSCRVRGCTQEVKNKISLIGLELAELNPDMPASELKALIKKQAAESFKRENYGAISWVWLMWWVIPKVAAWFLKWWLSQQAERV